MMLPLVFACTPVSVWDGDGPIVCAEGPHVRLAAISARERDGSCRRGHPCPRASGIDAARHLAGLTGQIVGESGDGHLRVEGPALACVASGESYGRTVARCRSAENGDLGCAMVRDGFALAWRRFGDPCEGEGAR